VTLLRVEGLRVRLGAHEALRGVSFEARTGEVLGVLGPSGAGKSTLFAAIAGERRYRGSVRLGDARLDGLPLWRRARLGIGWMPQTPSVLGDLTVADNLRSFERFARVETRPPAARAECVGLEGRLGVRARELSGGERRRLELLRVLIGQPKALLCDEPFAGVDPEAAELLGRLLRTTAAEGAAVLVADHRVGDVLAACDRACLLADGALEAETTASEFRGHPAVLRRYLG
jgi:lipopolysaccharide export system ATP-binding protein